MKEICEILNIKYGTGVSSKKGKTQQRLEKSFSTDIDLHLYEKEEDWIASKLSNGVIFLLNGKEYVSNNDKAEMSFKLATWEADDEVAYYVREKNWIGASMDKDLLRGVAGDWFKRTPHEAYNADNLRR